MPRRPRGSSSPPLSRPSSSSAVASSSAPPPLLGSIPEDVDEDKSLYSDKSRCSDEVDVGVGVGGGGGDWSGGDGYGYSGGRGQYDDDVDDELSSFVGLDPRTGRLVENPPLHTSRCRSRIRHQLSHQLSLSRCDPLPVTSTLTGRIDACSSRLSRRYVEPYLAGSTRWERRMLKMMVPFVAVVGVMKFSRGAGGRHMAAVKRRSGPSSVAVATAITTDSTSKIGRKLDDEWAQLGLSLSGGGGGGGAEYDDRGTGDFAGDFGGGNGGEVGDAQFGGEVREAVEASFLRGREREDEMIRSQLDRPRVWKGLMAKYRADASGEMGLTMGGGGGAVQDPGDVGDAEEGGATDGGGGVHANEAPAGDTQNPADGEVPAELASVDLPELSNFKDAWEPQELSDVPAFFRIPPQSGPSGGSTVLDVLSACHRFVLASERGVQDERYGNDVELRVVYLPSGAGGGAGTSGEKQGKEPNAFLNVDTTTLAGIRRARRMDLAESGLVDAVITPHLYESNELFTPDANGRLFAVFTHPIDRAVSMYYYLRDAEWDPNYSPLLKEMTLEQYAQSDKAENDYLVRRLTNKLAGRLTEYDLSLAMEIVRRKFLVGLDGDGDNLVERTVTRFERVFGWKYRVEPTVQEECRSRLLREDVERRSAGADATNRRRVRPGSEAWELLSRKNEYDLRLYEYVRVLFDEQEQFVEHVPEDYRMRGETCCRCDPATFPPQGYTCPPPPPTPPPPPAVLGETNR